MLRAAMTRAAFAFADVWGARPAAILECTAEKTVWAVEIGAARPAAVPAWLEAIALADVFDAFNVFDISQYARTAAAC